MTFSLMGYAIRFMPVQYYYPKSRSFCGAISFFKHEVYSGALSGITGNAVTVLELEALVRSYRDFRRFRPTSVFASSVFNSPTQQAKQSQLGALSRLMLTN